MRLRQALILLAAATSLSACASGVGGGGFGYGGYSLVRVKEVRVGNDSMAVTPPREWNKISGSLFVDIHAVEDWTQNGVYLDGISFVTGLKDGKALVYQRRRDDRQVPKFRSNMTPPEIAAMIESLFRGRAGAVDFKTLSMTPRPFLGTNGCSVERGLTTPDPAEAAVKRAMIAAARKTVLLADHTKIGNDYLARFGTLDDLDVLITDSGLNDELYADVASAGVRVVRA